LIAYIGGDLFHDVDTGISKLNIYNIAG